MFEFLDYDLKKFMDKNAPAGIPQSTAKVREGGKEEGREGGRERGREGEKKGGRSGAREVSQMKWSGQEEALPSSLM